MRRFLGIDPLQHLDMLSACFAATRSFLETFFTIPAEFFPRLTLMGYAQAGHAMASLLRLSLYQHERWDVQYVRSTFNFSTQVNNLIARFDAVATGMDLSNMKYGDDSITRGIRKCHSVKAWYDAKVYAEMGRETPRDCMVSGFEDSIMAGQFDYMDDAFWRELMAGPEMLR